MPKTSAVARSGCCSGISFEAIPLRDHGADRIDGRRGTRRELAQLAVLHEEQKPEEERVLVVRVTEAANHRGELSACGRLGKCQRLESRGKLHVVALEYFPHEFVFAVEVAIQSPLRDIDSPSDIPDGRRVDALLGEELNRRPLDALPGVGEAVSWHSK